MSRALGMALGVALAASGCFYTSPINELPDAEITKRTPGPHFPSDPIVFDALKSDDEDRAGAEAAWLAKVCDSVSPPQGCDPEPLASATRSLGETFEVVPHPRDHRPIIVQLTVRDERGARDQTVLTVDIGNRPPEIELQARGNESEGGSFVLARPLQVSAGAIDGDGDELTLSWTLEPPAASDPELRHFEPVGDDSYELIPDVSGVWLVRVTAEDDFGGVAEKELTLVVDADQPPCIELTEPAAVPDAAYVLGVGDAPRRFSVLRVDDDLHPFPPLADGDPVTGEPIFTWLFAGPDAGGDFAVVAEDGGADFVLDPAAYAPGDRLALRVEIDDTGERVLSCDDADPTCEVESGSGCVQRVTWEVEIR